VNANALATLARESERLVAVPPGGMCQYKVRLGGVEEVDQELLSWLHAA